MKKDHGIEATVDMSSAYLLHGYVGKWMQAESLVFAQVATAFLMLKRL